MIFVTVGSQKFPFNRLLKSIDECINNGVIPPEVFAQTGVCTYVPQNFKYKAFLNRADYALQLQKADMVITHGGTGAIVGALKQGKKVIAMPRLSKYGEHVDDHQVQLLEEFEKEGLVFVCSDAMTLGTAYSQAQQEKFVPYQSNNKFFIADLDKYLSRND